MNYRDLERVIDEQPVYPAEDVDGNIILTDDEISYFAAREFSDETFN